MSEDLSFRTREFIGLCTDFETCVARLALALSITADDARTRLVEALQPDRPEPGDEA